jgi:hypothetical protein
MADLIDRLSGASESEDPPRPQIKLHEFFSNLRLYAVGKMTAAETKVDLDLQGAELTQANLVIVELDTRVGATGKILYVLQTEAVATRLPDDSDTIYHNPDGTIDKTRVQADLDI